MTYLAAPAIFVCESVKSAFSVNIIGHITDYSHYNKIITKSRKIREYKMLADFE